MSKKFVKGNTYVFTTKIYKKSSHEKCKAGSWSCRCNGNVVEVDNEGNGSIPSKASAFSFFIVPEWCKCIKQGR